jgi:hypothetical protein
MKIQKEKFVLFIFFISSIFLGTFFWNLIELPYKDPLIVGIYSINEFNAFNDILRYLFFILFPVIVFLIFKIFYQKNSFKNIIIELRQKSIQFYKNDLLIKLSFLIFIFFTILEFLSLNFPLHKLDFIHEGQQLSSAYRSFLDSSLWSSSYITVGIFHETLLSKFIWSIFDNQSIGLFRYFVIFLTLISKALLILLVFKVSKFLNLSSLYKNVFFIFNSILVLGLIDYNFSNSDLLTYREIPVIIVSILFIEFLQNKKLKNYILISFGFISPVSIFWGVDRGLVTNLLILIIVIYFAVSKQYKEIFITIISICIFSLSFFLLIGDEFDYFLSNTLSIYKNMSYVHGLIHPTPFSDDPNSYRATKTLVSIIFTFLISINLFFQHNYKFSTRFKIFLFFLSVVSFISYIYALGRSDAPHMKEIFGYPILFLSIYLSYLLLKSIEEKKNFKILSKVFNINFLISTIFLSLFIFNLNIKNILNYNERFSKYIQLSDKKFLNENEIDFLNKAQPIVNNYNCIQLFSNDAALLYLLKKKSCSKYYFAWSVGSHANQKELIKDLIDTDLIISKGPSYNWDLPISKKLSLVNEFIKKKYYISQKIQEWEILVLK